MKKHQQQGTALISVMLIFVVASLVAIGFVRSERANIENTSRFIRKTQAIHYALGAESYAKQLVLSENNIAKLNTVLTKTPLIIPNAKTSIKLEDANARFNVNSLISGDYQAIQIFTRLSLSLGIKESKIKIITERISKKPTEIKQPPVKKEEEKSAEVPTPAKPTEEEKLETTSEPSTKEQEAPLAITRAGQWLTDASELIDYGMEIAEYKKIAPYLVALPTDSLAINANTASHRVLLAYLNDDSQAKTIRAIVQKQGYVESKDCGNLGIANSSITCKTDNFIVYVNVKSEGHETILKSLLMRKKNNQKTRILTISRNFGQPD